MTNVKSKDRYIQWTTKYGRKTSNDPQNTTQKTKHSKIHPYKTGRTRVLKKDRQFLLH